jgi:hypothetical protein
MTVMTEFDFKRSSRQCSATGQPIERGTDFYSVLLEQDDSSLTRQDISATAWQGPPENCIGWWRSRLPSLEKGRVYWAPNEVLVTVFQHASSTPGQEDIAYVMALLLVRKRILQWKETVQRDGRPWMRLHDARQNTDLEVAEASLTAQRVAEIQAELAEKLFTDERTGELDPGTAE